MRFRQVLSGPAARGLAAGFAVLVVVLVLYPSIGSTATRPLAAFVLPPLLTAVVSGWRQTLLVGAASVVAATLVGIAGPLTGSDLVVRLVIIVLAVGTGAVGAWFREQQQRRLHDLTESSERLRTFERSLVPEVDPPPGFDVAVRYAASERHMDIGGDFVDAVGLPDGRLAVVIGDVCGHGPSEAAYGTALRAAWRTIALTTRPDPIEWVQRLDTTFFAGDRTDAYVTLCTGIVDRRTGRARLVSAGHPWPVALGATSGLVAMPAGAPLGLGPRGWTATDLTIGQRGLLLYTDGLIENPRGDGPPDRWGEDGLVRWLQGRWPAPDLGRLVDELLEAALDGREQRDDVAVVLVCPADQAANRPAWTTTRSPRRLPAAGRVMAVRAERRWVAAGLAAVGLTLVATACVDHPIGPARTFGSFEGKAVTTAESALSAVETVLLLATAASDGHSFSNYTAVAVSEQEDALGGLRGTFASIQPPDDDAVALREDLTPILDAAFDDVGAVRIEVRRGHLADLDVVAAPLERVSTDLQTFVDEHG
jgi:hypothetical protein